MYHSVISIKMWSILLISTVLIQILSGIDGKALKSDDEPRIVIIGAGLAGVTALSELLDNGYRNVVLLEAQDRVGGRIQTVPFGANVADLGAQWVHGEKNNVIYEMVSRYGLLDKSPYAWLGIGGKEGNYYGSDGQIKPEYGELAEMTREFSKELEEEVEEYDGSTGIFFTKM